MIRIPAIIIPNGFLANEPEISPFISDNTARVDPQEGQGIFVIRLNKQTVIPLKFELL
jgi:hypothetical protein